MKSHEILFIINPAASGGKTLKEWNKKIYPLLEKENFSFDYEFTTKPLDAFELALEGIKKGYKRLISVGGDGTVNEIANAILTQNIIDSTEIALGSIGTGTGNDWRKTVGIPKDYKQAIKVIKEGKYILQDVGKVNYFQNGQEKSRFFINVAGMGFDAVVTYKANARKKHYFKKFVYSINLFSTLFSFKDPYIEIKIDGKKVYEDKSLTLNVGICKYSGGGMMFTPNAIYDDGLFDITVVDKISIFKILINLRKIYDGSFINNDAVKTFKAKNIEITSKEKIYLEVDGESLGHCPFHFKIYPKRLKVIVR